MQEIVLVLGSVAGACTAIAIDKIPKRKNDKLIFRSNPAIKNQVEALKIEKEILTKTISRLYQQESEHSKIQRDKLLLRYQNQLGLVIARIEKLEEASKHPDLGPLGDGLIILMDQKLSQLDKRLHELSSKIIMTSIPSPQIKQQETREEVPKKSETKTSDMKIEPKKVVESYTRMPPIDISVTEPHKSVELVTLTEIPDKMPDFPEELVKPTVIVTPKQSTDQKVVNPPEHIEEQKMKQDEPIVEIQRTEQSQAVTENKIKIPPVKIPEEEKLDDDDKDIDKIKSEIMKALSKLEQVEVE